MTTTAGLQEVSVAALPPQRLVPVLGADRVAHFQEVAATLQQKLGGHVIWNVSSTAQGGGVAEMLRALLGWARGVGMDARWLVIPGPPEFFALTKRVHNHIYGFAGDGGELGPTEHALYASTLAPSAQELRAVVRAGDVVVLHDPQTAGLADAVRAVGAIVVWRCHIGRDHPNHFSAQGWGFLEPYLRKVDQVVVTLPAFAPPWLTAEQVSAIPPSIDPFSPKNHPLSPEQVRGILVHTGVLQGLPDAAALPTFTRTDGSPDRVDRRADVLQSGPPAPPDVPLVVQVSRWDHAKDMGGVMASFAELVAPRTPAHLLLAGPAVTGVADDPEARAVLLACMQQWSELPDWIRARIHLACLPMADIDENAAIVNAIQRHASVVTQKSLAEGFGLTVAEAMWKGRAVVASAVGGIQAQVVDGASGILLDDPHDLAAFGAALRQLLDDPALAEKLGQGAEQRVRDMFLGDTHLERWVALLLTLLGTASGGATS